MLALAHLTFDLPTTSLQDSVQKAIKIIHAHELNSIAVLDGKKWIGNVTEEMLMHAMHPDGKLSQFAESWNYIKMEAEEDILASLPLFEESGFQMLPVVSEEGNWQGYLTWESVAKTIFFTGFNSGNGGIIRILFHSQRDSLSSIARIIEENKGMITRTYLTKTDRPEHNSPELIIQVQTEQFPTIIKSLERHDVHIEKAFMFGSTELVDQSRFDLLLKYLNP